jgi:hypothetical protein
VLTLRTTLAKESPAQGEYRAELALTESALAPLIGDGRRSTQLADDAIARARALVTADPVNNDYRETLCLALVAQADAARAAHDAGRRAAALGDALEQTRAAFERAPRNVRWPGLIAEIQTGLAELAAGRGDTAAAAAARQAVRDALEPLARAGRLSAIRQPLLDRVRTNAVH